MGNIKYRVCRQCGTSFPGGPRAWYCPSCRKEREKLRATKYRKAGFSRHLGDVDICQKCGNEYIIKSGLQKYCENCKDEAMKEIDRKQGLEWYHNNATIYNPKRYSNRRKIYKICIVCGKEFIRDGTPRNTCSDACKKIRIHEHNRRADEKRREKKQNDR